MSRSPTGEAEQNPQQAYLDAWQQLAKRIQRGQSFSGRERNCVFLNTQGPRFADISAAVGLDHIDDSRAVALSDWDHDGDLDIWLANRTAPRVRFLRNDFENDNHSISFRLIGNPGRRCPRDAIGARMELTVRDANGEQQRRIQTLTAGDGFLSQSSKRVFFGIAADSVPVQIEVHWPGSEGTEIFADLAADQHYRITQGSGQAELVPARTNVMQLPEMPPLVKDVSNSTRVWRSSPAPTEPMAYASFRGDVLPVRSLHDGPLLITLWASWCVPCLEELEALTRHEQEIKRLGGNVLALNVEALQAENAAKGIEQQAEQLLAKMSFPFRAGMATQALVEQLDALRKQTIYRQDALPIPASFLLDPSGQLRVLYTGAAPLDQLLDDLRHLDANEQQSRDRAVPFAGRWSNGLFVTNPIAIANIYRDEHQFQDATEYLRRYLEKVQAPDPSDQSAAARQTRLRLADVYQMLGRLALDQQATQDALTQLKQALALQPRHVEALVDLGQAMMRAGRPDLAVKSLTRATQLRKDDANTFNQLGLAQLRSDDVPAAIASFQAALSANPNWLPAANNLAWLWATHPDGQYRNGALAVKVAEESARKDGTRPDVLDTLAAAYAENEDFGRAIQVAERALLRAKQLKHDELAERISMRLKLYQAKQPYRER